MSSWMEQLERELDARLSAFLSTNPVQENLFSEQHQRIERQPCNGNASNCRAKRSSNANSC